MAIFTNTFGGNPVNPASPSYNLIDLSSDIVLEWATAFQNTDYAVSAIMNVNPVSSGFTVQLPNATYVSPGTAFIITNTSSDGAVTFTLLQSDTSVLIPAISNAEGYFVYLQDNTTAVGSWGIIPFVGSDAVTFIAAVSNTAGLTITGSPITGAGTFQFSINLGTLWSNQADNTLSAIKLLAGTVTTDKIADLAVTLPKLGTGFGVVNGYAQITASGTISQSLNISSVVKLGTGSYQINISNPSNKYIVISANCTGISPAYLVYLRVSATQIQVTSFDGETGSESDEFFDLSYSLI